MSRYHQFQSSSNPFDDDDEEQDGDFVVVGNKKSPTQAVSQPPAKSGMGGSSSYNSTSSKPAFSASNHQWGPRQNPYSQLDHSSYPADNEDNPFEDRRQQALKKIQLSENNQLESTQRALASLYESEAMGIATAEELVRQGETLDNIETKTDGMQQNLKTSQRHLNNIKSVFGGIKNWWSGDKKAPTTNTTQESANSKLRATIEKNQKSKPDVSGFYEEDDEDLDSKFMAGSNRKLGSGQYTMIQPVTRSAREEEVDYNLELMSHGMSKLKGLATGLGDEIERQNEQLDRINLKVEKTDDLLGHQNSQMRRILKK